MKTNKKREEEFDKKYPGEIWTEVWDDGEGAITSKLINGELKQFMYKEKDKSYQEGFNQAVKEYAMSPTKKELRKEIKMMKLRKGLEDNSLIGYEIKAYNKAIQDILNLPILK